MKKAPMDVLLACCRGLLLASGLLFATTLSVTPDAASLDGDASVFESLEKVALNELENLRGGFLIAGLELEFGASVRTLIDGRPVLESHVIFTSDGPMVSNVANPPNSMALQIQGEIGDSQMAKNAGDDMITVPSVFEDAGGVIVNDGRGPTFVAHQATRERILSAIISRASGITARQEVELDVTIRNFREFQRAARSAVATNRIGRQSNR